MKNQEKSESVFKVHSDILFDVITLIVREQLKHEAILVSENRKTVSLAIMYDKTIQRHIKVIQNIKNLLSNYDDYRFGSDENVNWRDN